MERSGTLGLNRFLFIYLLILCFIFTACTSTGNITTFVTEEAEENTIPITNDLGEIIASQPGPVWALVSGSDEHDMIIQRELILLTAPDPATENGPSVFTGSPVVVHEIRQSGPQALRRFYRIETLDGKKGWISDFYVRRVVYLYNEEKEAITVYSEPDGAELAQLPNISPVKLLDPTRDDWWQVELISDNTVAWVQADYVRDSSVKEFLLIQRDLLKQ